MRAIENTEIGQRDRPVNDVVIKDSGEITVEEPFPVEK